MSGQRINVNHSKFEEDWSDKDVYVIGAGPSLTGFDFSNIPTGAITIGANKSAFIANTNVLCTIDRLFVKNYIEQIEAFDGLKVIGTTRPTTDCRVESATYLQVSRKEPLSQRRDRLCGLNSGFSCMNLAYLGGSKRIHLLGIDMKKNDGIKHFHGGYEWDKGNGGNYKGWIRFFDKASEIMKKDGVEVIQYVGPHGTDMKCFTQIPIQELDPNYGT